MHTLKPATSLLHQTLFLYRAAHRLGKPAPRRGTLMELTASERLAAAAADATSAGLRIAMDSVAGGAPAATAHPAMDALLAHSSLAWGADGARQGRRRRAPVARAV